MSLFLEQLMAFPTVFFTALLAISLVYWLFVIIGALDIDLFHLDLDGDGVADALFETAGGAAEAAHEGLSLAGLAGWLGLRSAPFTVIMSVIALAGWAFSMLGVQYLGPLLSAVLPSWLTAVTLFVVAFFAAIPVTRFLARPLGALFHTHEAERREDFVGRTCRVETGSVDERFGQAAVEDGGSWSKIQVRTDRPGLLGRGDQALIVAWEPEREAFRVEPLRPAAVMDEREPPRTSGEAAKQAMATGGEPGRGG